MRNLNPQAAEQIRAEETTSNPTRLLRAIRDVNRLIVRVNDRGNLLKGVCDNLVETDRYVTAWIALFDESGELQASAESGLGESFLPLAGRLRGRDLPYCARKALAQSGAVTIKDTIRTCGDCPLAETYDGRAAMTARLEHVEKVYGILTVSAPAGFAAQPEEQSLLKELAGDIAFALYNMKREQGRKRAECTLEEAQAYAESIIATVREPLLVLDADLRVISASRSFYQTFQVAPEQTGGRVIYELGNHQWDIPKLRDLLERILPKDSTFDDFEVEHDFETIGRRVMLLNARRIYTEGNRTQMILLAIEDITERKRVEEDLARHSGNLEQLVDERTTELEKTDERLRQEISERKHADEELRASEPKLAAAQRLAHLGDLTWDVVTGEVTWSEGMYHLMGYDPNERDLDLAKVNTDIYHPDDLQRVTKWLKDCLASGTEKLTPNEYRVVRKNGDVIWIHTEGTIEYEDGKPTKVFGACHDITERKQAVRAVEAAREYAESIIATVREPLVVLDADLRVISASRSFYQTFQVAPEETEGWGIYELGNRQWDIPKLRDLLERILPKKSAFDDIEVEHDFETIGRRIMLLNARRIYREANRTHMILLAIEDITERKKSEEELKKHRDHLEGLVEIRTRELSEAIKELESFNYSVSHDLRAPLRAISGFSGILAEEYSTKLDDEGKRLLNVIQENTRTMEQLIDGLLVLSHLGRQEISSSHIDMEKLAQVVFEELESDTPGPKPHLTIRELPPAYGDPAMIRQVFTNLLSNAVKFTTGKTEPEIEIGGKEEEHTVVYSVKDNGVGFDMEYVDKLFGVFQRLHSGADFRGSGIGLANVKRIITRHGGQVWAEGRVGEGATFYFTLPKSEAYHRAEKRGDFAPSTLG